MKKIKLIFLLSFCLAITKTYCQSAPTAFFMVNGDSTHLPGLWEDTDPINGDAYIAAKKFNLNISAKIDPEIELTLKINVVGFDDFTRNTENVIGMLLRRNSNQEDLHTFGSNTSLNGKQGSFKLAITQYSIMRLPTKNLYGIVLVSGTFEGELLCTSSGCEQAPVQQITSGKFENIQVALWK